MDHIINSLIRIPECFKPPYVFINRSFSYITTTGKWDFKRAKSLEKSRKEKYSDTDFFDEFCIEIIKTHMSTIYCESISLEIYNNSE